MSMTYSDKIFANADSHNTTPRTLSTIRVISWATSANSSYSKYMLSVSSSSSRRLGRTSLYQYTLLVSSLTSYFGLTLWIPGNQQYDNSYPEFSILCLVAMAFSSERLNGQIRRCGCDIWTRRAVPARNMLIQSMYHNHFVQLGITSIDYPPIDSLSRRHVSRKSGKSSIKTKGFVAAYLEFDRW